MIFAIEKTHRMAIVFGDGSRVELVQLLLQLERPGVDFMKQLHPEFTDKSLKGQLQGCKKYFGSFLVVNFFINYCQINMGK
jgi:hypothetical protein